MQKPHYTAPDIEVTIADPRQLFDGLDASPQPHLADSVERFIVHRAQEAASALSLVVRVPDGTLLPADAVELSEKIRRHFAHRSNEEGLKLQGLGRAALRDLAIGIVFLFICAAVGLLAVGILPPALGLFVEQGLLILGWVALWRPVDLFLYELRPLRQSRDVLSRLSGIEVRVRPDSMRQPVVVAA